MRAAMVGGVGYAAGKHHAATASHEQEQDRQIAEAQPQPAAGAAPASAPPSGPSSESDRIDALTKLKSLLDSGVLTQEQYESERQRLTQGI